MNIMELCSANESLYDFCLWEYPAVVPVAGKLRSVNVLYRSFDVADIGGGGRETVAAIRAGLGMGRSVWGIKHDGAALSWEFYFYDYERERRTRSLPRLLNALAKRWRGCLPAVEATPHFMFSLDLQSHHFTDMVVIDTADIYVGNPGSQVSSGICYAIGNGPPRLKNFYFFFDAATQMKEILAKARTSMHLDYPGFRPEHVLWPDFCDCRTIVVANKSDRDGVYFSRVSVVQLLSFMRRLAWPASLIDFVAAEQSRLDHLLFDVGFDYRVENGRFTITKSACYGFF
ncbi:hypothetical protein [Quatrionicoccus australiensis]|uniref:hypothetical protein n=1 Tax=Quatrionicoccus australiensis TaxID=138118 RepID=UPI001CF92CA1|nr:hypothetical protein [Quatrionicoccus australiensis]UCV14041.1 hypothetical protein KI612_13920 [Quatrionicoccus australiensis]